MIIGYARVLTDDQNLELFPIRWKQLIDQEMRRDNKIDRIRSGSDLDVQTDALQVAGAERLYC